MTALYVSIFKNSPRFIVTLSDKGLIKLSGLWPCSSEKGTHVLGGGRGESPPLGGLHPPVPITPTAGTRRAWRQPGGGGPPHILDVLFQGLVTERTSILPLKIHFPLHCVKSQHVYMFFTISGK
jgi:hypothetical protein